MVLKQGIKIPKSDPANLKAHLVGDKGSYMGHSHFYEKKMRMFKKINYLCYSYKVYQKFKEMVYLSIFLIITMYSTYI